jgi:hypothetical protein
MLLRVLLTSSKKKPLVMHFLRWNALYFTYTEHLSRKFLLLNKNICLLAGFMYISTFLQIINKIIYIYIFLLPKQKFPVAHWLKHPNRNRKNAVKNFLQLPIINKSNFGASQSSGMCRFADGFRRLEWTCGHRVQGFKAREECQWESKDAVSHPRKRRSSITPPQKLQNSQNWF